MKTARGVYHNIEESDIDVYLDGFLLYFSSNTLKGKFLGKYEDYYNKTNNILKKVYPINYEPLIILSLYKNIEKRGFRVYYNDRRVYDEFIRIEV
jgi:hypothetical protein